MKGHRICKKCGFIQEEIPHTAPWVEPCTNCSSEDIEFVKEHEPEFLDPRICPKCHTEKIGRFVYGPAFTLTDLQKEIEEGKVRAAGSFLFPESPLWFCRECNYEWH